MKPSKPATRASSRSTAAKSATPPASGKQANTAVEPLLPVRIPHTAFRQARGVKAGRWCFVTGASGTDYESGLAPEVVNADHPLNGETQSKREARRAYANVKEVLGAAGASFDDIVRVDQYYTTPRAMHPYHEVRREVLGAKIPPSTSNIHKKFSRTGQTIELQVMAALPGHGVSPKHETFAPSYAISPTSGYSPALSAGDFRFIPGQTAEIREGVGPIDPEARSVRSFWRETPIKLETDFIVNRKLKASLAGAGAGLETVCKAQVYLSDREDVPAFNEAWLAHFETPPATTIIATNQPGFGIEQLRIEINTLSLAVDGKTKKQVITGREPPLFDGYVSAVKAGDLLFISGLMAMESGKLITEAAVDARQPYYGIPVKAELRSILDQAEHICAAAGTSIANVVRIQQFHTDLADLPASLEVWNERLDGAPLPISPIECLWLPLPGARVQCDLWVYVPGGA